MRSGWIAGVGLIAWFPAARTGAAQPIDPEPRPALVARPALEWTAVGVGGALWLSTGALIKTHIAPSECRWCDPNGFDDELRSLRWSDAQAADLASDVLSYGLAPVVAGGLVSLAAIREGRAAELSADLVIVSEAVVAAGLLGEAFRFGTARERPSVHALPADEKSMTDHPEENNLSFVSGHSATSFALAVAAGRVASLRRRRLAPLIWATGITLAVATSYLRLASDEHYATDVLGGVAIGTGIGFVVPLLHQSRGAERVSAAVAPTPGGAMVVLMWR
jgi:membrane-associated phospholipid phosphatase